MENNVSLQQADDVSSDQCSCDEEGENPVVNIGSDKVELNLTLDNFDADDVPDDCPFVLTSPRSLEACKIVGVRPVDLLPFRIQDARRQLEIEGDFTFEALNILRNAEDERRELLETCRDIRRELISKENNAEEITTDSGKGYTSDGSNSSRSSPERPSSFQVHRVRKTNVISRLLGSQEGLSDATNLFESRPVLRKYVNCPNLSDFQRGRSSSPDSSKRSSVVTFCEEPTLVFHQAPQNPHRPTSSSKKLFRNPYGPPLYPRQRPQVAKKKARRKRKMITVKVPLTTMESLKSNHSKRSSHSMKELKKAFEGQDLLRQDRVILERLAFKHLQTAEDEDKAESFQKLWSEEMGRWQEYQKNHSILWQQELHKKRMMEAESNASRLMTARKRLIESQEQLRWLILQKAQRAEKAATRFKAQRFHEWRANEESRRVAVEAALAELLARDTQYRKDLKAHIEQRLQFAEQRRRTLRFFSKERKNASNQDKNTVHHQRLTEIDKKHLLHVEAVREAVKQRLAKAESLLSKRLEQQKSSRKAHYEKVLILKAELESKLDLWRKQVLEVQSKSLEKAELLAKKLLDQRRLRAASEIRERQSRHRERLDKVQIEFDDWRSQQLEQYKAKLAIHDRAVAKKRREHLDTMKKAKRAADLRQLVKSMHSIEDIWKYTSNQPISMELKIAKVNYETYETSEPVSL